MKKSFRVAFTLIELMVGVTILAVLGAIAFTSFTGNIGTSRDSVRLDNFAKIQLYLSNYKEKHGVYPLPTEGFNITNKGKIIAIQGNFNQEFLLDSFDSVPVDPSTKLPYPYSILKNRSAYQIASTLEDNGVPKSLIQGNYTSVSKNILPSIIMAIAPGAGTDVEINQTLGEGLINSKKFLFNNNSDNLPYALDGSRAPVSSDIELSALLSTVESENYWQNIDYKSCKEIYDAGRYIGDGEYQILLSGNLVNTNCSIDSPIMSCGQDVQTLLVVPPTNLCTNGNALGGGTGDQGQGAAYHWGCTNGAGSTIGCYAYHKCEGVNLTNSLFITNSNFCLQSDTSIVQNTGGYNFNGTLVSGEYSIKTGVNVVGVVNNTSFVILENNSKKYLTKKQGTGLKFEEIDYCGEICAGSHTKPFTRNGWSYKIYNINSIWYSCLPNAGNITDCSQLSTGSTIIFGVNTYDVSINSNIINLTLHVPSCADNADQWSCQAQPSCMWIDPPGICIQ